MPAAREVVTEGDEISSDLTGTERTLIFQIKLSILISIYLMES